MGGSKVLMNLVIFGFFLHSRGSEYREEQVPMDHHGVIDEVNAKNDHLNGEVAIELELKQRLIVKQEFKNEIIPQKNEKQKEKNTEVAIESVQENSKNRQIELYWKFPHIIRLIFLYLGPDETRNVCFNSEFGFKFLWSDIGKSIEKKNLPRYCCRSRPRLRSVQFAKDYIELDKKSMCFSFDREKMRLNKKRANFFNETVGALLFVFFMIAMNICVGYEIVKAIEAKHIAALFWAILVLIHGSCTAIGDIFLPILLFITFKLWAEFLRLKKIEKNVYSGVKHYSGKK